MGSCLTLGNELSDETLLLTEQETVLAKGCLGREHEGKGTQENCSATWFYGDRVSFQVVSGPSF